MILRKLLREKEIDSEKFMLHLYNLHCEIMDTGIDPTLRFKGTFKLQAPEIDFTATLKKMRSQFGEEVKIQSDEKIGSLNKKIDDLETYTKNIKPVVVGSAEPADLGDWPQKYKKLQDRLQQYELQQQPDTVIEDFNSDLRDRIRELREIVDKLEKENKDAAAAAEAQPPGTKTLEQKQIAFHTRETLIKPDEQLDVNDRDMVDALVRNPGVGAFTIAFIIFHYGISLGRSTMLSLQKDLPEEELEMLAAVEAKEKEAEGFAVDKAKDDMGFAADQASEAGASMGRTGAGDSAASSIGSKVSMVVDKIHVIFSVAVSTILPILMLIVQFAYVFLIFSEAEQSYSGEFCPGYNISTLTIVPPDHGSVYRIRTLMVFVGIYFIAKTFGQALTYQRALTERTVAKDHKQRKMRSVLLHIVQAICRLCSKRQRFSAGDSEPVKALPDITWKGIECQGCKQKRQALYGVKPTTEASEPVNQKGSARKVDKAVQKKVASKQDSKDQDDGAVGGQEGGTEDDSVAAAGMEGSKESIEEGSEQVEDKGGVDNEDEGVPKRVGSKQDSMDQDDGAVAGQEGGKEDNIVAAGIEGMKEGYKFVQQHSKESKAAHGTKAAVSKNVKAQAGAGKGTGPEDECLPEWCATCANQKHAKDGTTEKYDYLRACDMEDCVKAGRYAVNWRESDEWGVIRKYRFCRAHAVHGCTAIQHQLASVSKLCLAPDLYQACTNKECYDFATYTLRHGKGTEHFCERHAFEEAEKRHKILSMPEKAMKAIKFLYPLANNKLVSDFERKQVLQEFFIPFLRHNMWRDVQDSAIYPIFCFDVCVNLALVYCVLLCNLYIVFVDGASVQDILSKVVILDFVYMLQSTVKRELLTGSNSKKFIDSIKASYNTPGDIHVNHLCSVVFADALYVLNFFPFVVSLSMTFYGPLCKPGLEEIGFLPIAKKGK